MNRFLRRPGPLLSALLALAAATQCAAAETVLRVALPHSYAREAEQRAGAAPRCLPQGAACVRYRYALGSDYQLLEWLQNGKVDAAVVSAMTLELVRRTVGPRFDREFLVGASLPLGDLPLRRYRVTLRAERERIPLPDPQAQLDGLFEALLAGGRREDTVLELASHLSAGMPALYARAGAWLAQRGADTQRARDALMEGLVARLRFAAGGASRAPLRLMLAEDDGGPLAHVFLVRRLALPPALAAAENSMPPLGAERALLDYLAGAAEAGAPGGELRRFGAGNYVSESAGWRSRFRFAFTLDELRGILHSHGAPDPAGDDGIALVLTGGGVKAAYQTRLIDHLYGQGYLRNLYAPGTPDPAAVPVKYVVGTSGGALLGIFVASLDDSFPPPDLSTRLWRRHDDAGNPGALLSSAEVFPKLDLMRWLSLVWCMAIFAAVCGATSMVLRRVRGRVFAGARDASARFWRTSVWWLALLAATPWLLAYLNGEHGAEHIPAIQGLLYFFFLLIAIYSDNRLAVGQAPRPVESAWPPAVALAGGAALVAGALLMDRTSPTIDSFMDFSIARPALVACFGLLIVFLGLHWAFVRCAPRLEPLPRHVLPAFLLLAGVCALSYVLLFAATALGFGSLFELTLEFWAALGAMALAVSAALAWLAYGGGVRALRRRFDYLLTAHPSRCDGASHWISTARYSRMILAFALGWGWWNLIVAPGLYGNENALRYFQAAARNVFGESALGERGSLEVTFRAFYAVPVTALEKGIERYVMFQPPQAYDPGAGSVPLVGYRSWLSTSNDPRWLAIDSAERQRELVMRVAFASGSPFPVFPAHRIRLPGIGEELLVDGGYAHNVPVEAGKRLGARRVLVINSSPREPAGPPRASESGLRFVGNLTWMLRWIIPYLYERSQVEDALSAEDLVVGLIAPSASPRGWPFLTDFRDEVIARMFQEALQDRALRIGSVENWGRPSFVRRR